MSLDPSAPAYPTQNGCKNDPGMTIRATMAMHMHAAMLTLGYSSYNTDERAKIAEEEADALIYRLNRTEP